MALRLYRNQKFLQVLRSIRQTRSGHYDAHHHHVSKVEIAMQQKTHMDCLPKPKGKWQDLHNKRQQTANLALIIGSLLFVVGYVGTKDIWDDILWRPPYEHMKKDFPGAKFSD